ncbi:MAG: hypothetical protein IGS48_09120 [Oscillatoriales cyanobacterium C42_A2020_001]|nr:hypothetical protein [Leptolyngbyaceae cyanobacterium C42_A2020_001]
MHCVFASALDQGWALSTTNRPTTTLGATWYVFYRRPRALAVCQPNYLVEQLLQAHLELRQQMMTDLNLHVLPETSVQAFFEQMQKVRTQSRQTLWRKSVIAGMGQMLLFWLNPKTEWLGDYGMMLAERRKSM